MVSDAQLEAWSHTGADKGSAKTYEKIRGIIEQSSFERRKDVEIFLQGSYPNTTNIRVDSDIDVVVMLKSVWNANKENLNTTEKEIYAKHTIDSPYGHEELRADLIKIFNSYTIEQNNKCFKVKLGEGYLDADIVPSLSYRIYQSYSDSKRDNYVEGISIKTKNEGKIIHNFPKQHIKNGSEKHQATNQYYKKVVRIFKNLKKKIVDEGKINKDVAPSYFIECLLYNIPNDNYRDSLKISFLNCLLWLGKNKENLANLNCQNKITKLFGNEITQWNIQDCNDFIDALFAWKKEDSDA